MADREKVLKDLEMLESYRLRKDIWDIVHEAVELLKEQEIEGPNKQQGVVNMNGMTLAQIVEQVKTEKVRIIVDITPNEDGTVTQHMEVEPWEPFEMKCPYGK